MSENQLPPEVQQEADKFNADSNNGTGKNSGDNKPEDGENPEHPFGIPKEALENRRKRMKEILQEYLSLKLNLPLIIEAEGEYDELRERFKDDWDGGDYLSEKFQEIEELGGDSEAVEERMRRLRDEADKEWAVPGFIFDDYMEALENGAEIDEVVKL